MRGFEYENRAQVEDNSRLKTHEWFHIFNGVFALVDLLNEGPDLDGIRNYRGDPSQLYYAAQGLAYLRAVGRQLLHETQENFVTKYSPALIEDYQQRIRELQLFLSDADVLQGLLKKRFFELEGAEMESVDVMPSDGVAVAGLRSMPTLFTWRDNEVEPG